MMMFVPWDDGAGTNLLGEEQQMLRAIGFWTDLQQELRAGRGDTLTRTPRSKFAFVLVQDHWLMVVTPGHGVRRKAENADNKKLSHS